MNQVQAWGPPDAYPYSDFEAVVAKLYAVEEDHPGIAKVFDIGDSWETTVGLADRDILAIKISDNPGVDEDEPEVLIIARLHANEAAPTEIVLQIIQNLTDMYGSDSRLSWLVDNRETWIIPVANPDGMEYAMKVDDTWRKNRRLNYDGSYGIDLNRNFDGSQNGDPLGEWGGAGTSDDPSSLIYCGEYAFSEPETQAIRDLAMGHDFEIALDFHYAANWIMWPWGYTTDPAPDSEALASIGVKYAELTDYAATESAVMYPTTGDSCDWLYGGAGVYSYCVEISPWWSAGIVDKDLPANVQATMLVLEIAGDRNQAPFEIAHVPLGDSIFSDGGYDVTAEITAERGVDAGSVSLNYRVDGGEWSEVAMSADEGTSCFRALIPPAVSDSLVEYYICARDLGGVEMTLPRYAPYDVYSFTIVSDVESPSADAGHNLVSSVGDEVEFDGSGSYDDVGIGQYVWSFVCDGVLVELYGAVVTYSFIVAGSYEVLLTVSDSAGNVDTDTVVVKVLEART